MNLEVKNTKNGKGIFTLKEVKANAVIFKVQGSLVKTKEIHEDQFSSKSSNSFRFSKNLYLSPTHYIGDFLNHSCLPNAFIEKIKNKLLVKAIGKISENTEVTIDYSTTIADDDDWFMKCECGFKKCRKRIGRFTSLPQKIQEYFIENKYIPKYILDINNSVISDKISNNDKRKQRTNGRKSSG